MSSQTLARKPRGKPAPYNLKQRSQAAKKTKDAPATSAKPDKTITRKNLTLNDWLIDFAYIDTHPNQSQAEIVAHFNSLPTGAFTFGQSALSRALKRRPELEGRIHSNPNALSSKRPRIVTRPKTPDYTLTQVISLCRQLEDACLQFGDLGESFDLSKRLRKFRACVHREEIRELKQTTVDSYFRQ